MDELVQRIHKSLSFYSFFDEQTVVAYTAVGELMIKGEGLHINKLSLETGELTLDGEIASLTYTENRSSNGSFFSKLFR